ncbi:lipoprotein [Rhizobium helianthi]|uniref:Lipoprotein n=1 Tax=Rhizobium helianthi TaxID=1132695 RepID=A0ABW4M115_9HYPH
MSNLRKIARMSVAVCIAGLVVTGCGRKGNLDKPSTPVEQQNLRKTGKEQSREPVAEKPFLLDPLL